MAVFERKSLFRLTFPLFVYAILSIGVAFVDQLLLAAYAENLAAAVSVANQILGVAYDLSGLLAVGAVILVSQCLGREDVTGAQRIAAWAIAANTFLSAVIAAVLMIGRDSFLDWVNTPDEIRSDAAVYILVISFAMVVNGFIMAATAVLRAFGHTWIILGLGLLANFAYLFFEYTLIFGNFGFPELGVLGSALATLIVRIASIAFLLWMLARALKLSPRHLFRPPCFASVGAAILAPRHLIWRLTRLSVPSVFDNILYNLYQLTVVALISVLGTASILTRSYALTMTALVSVVARVVSQGNEVLVGYDKGAEAFETARKRALRNALQTGLAMGALSALLWFFSDPLTGLFTEDRSILRGVETILLIGIALHPFQAINLILFNSLKITGDVYWPVAYSLGVTFLIALPLVWIAMQHLGWNVESLWLIYTLEEAIKAGIMYVRWQRKGWTHFQVLDIKEPVVS